MQGMRPPAVNAALCGPLALKAASAQCLPGTKGSGPPINNRWLVTCDQLKDPHHWALALVVVRLLNKYR